ncbi:MAG: hypothetical protein MUF75_02660 [Bacteroidia bacterium]|nr:hypothetical protein [Bacteroidia bacterium]
MYYLFRNISILSALPPLIALLFVFKTKNPIKIPLLVLCLSAALSDGICYLLAKQGIGSITVWFIYTIFEGLSIFALYALAIERKSAMRLITPITLTFLLIAVLTILNSWSNEWLSSFEALAVVFISTRYFFYLLKNPMHIHITGYYFFWINAAFFYYFASSFLFFYFENTLRTIPPPHIHKVYSLHLFNNLLYNLTLAFGIWKLKTRA